MNIASLIDARIKTVFVVTAILGVITSSAAVTGFAVSSLLLFSLFISGARLKTICYRLAAPLFVAAVAATIKIFLCREAAAGAIMIISRILGASSLVLFLSMTTTVDKLLAACRYFKVSKTWIEICLIAYRYIFVLMEDALTVYDAQRVRLGYTGLLRSLRSAGVLAGMVIIRAYDQSIATYEAMISRGYKHS